jgi:uncharacterized protein (TIGR02678 family)
MSNRIQSSTIAEHQRQARSEELREAVRALLMRPLMPPSDASFAVVRRHAEALTEWFQREAGWRLDIDRDGARLFKRPGDTGSSVRGFPGYDRRRYVVLCLACAALERADAQITLRVLGEHVLSLAADPKLAAAGFTFALATQGERRELVAVCRTLLDLGILVLVAGEEEAYVRGGDSRADALYDVRRRMLAGVLAAVRGPSSFRPEAAPGTTAERVRALTGEVAIDSDEGRRTAIRHRLARRLLDDPVVYVDDLEGETLAYYTNQRGAMAARLAEATGLVVEQRAEGLALVDPDGELTDVAMPAEGTEAHVTLIVAELLAGRVRAAPLGSVVELQVSEIVDHLAKAKRSFGKFWRKSALLPGSEMDLATIALARLESLHLLARDGETIRPLPAIARFSLDDIETSDQGDATTAAAPGPLLPVEVS